jgi:acetyl esterase
MIERIRLGLLRWLVRVAVAYKWRGKRATNLHISEQRIDVDQGQIAVRSFRPEGAGPFPVILFFHGGGWVGFDLDTHDPVCRDLCTRTGHLVVSVDYRLAPEHPFPIGVHDCLHALDWARANVASLGGDPERLLVAGDSAGGNLAAVVALQARKQHPGLIRGQVLVYPVTDHASADWPSYRSCSGRGYPLSYDGLQNLWEMYVRNSRDWAPGQTSHDLATPYRVKDLSGLPRTLLLIADDDLLRDEGLAYGERLKQAGIDVTLRRYPGQKHGFFGLEPTPAHKQAIDDIAVWLGN